MTPNSQHSTLNTPESDWDRSALAWIEYVDRGDPNRDVLLDPVMLRAAGDVNRLRICDVGCGEGRFCRILAERGAIVTGIDRTRFLTQEARNRHPEGEYLRSSAESLPFAPQTFDIVASYLNLIDVEDFRAAIHEMARILRPGGALIVANLSGQATANMTGWTKDESGEKIAYPIDHYLQERGVAVAWCGIQVVNYHRPLSNYMRAFLESGLTLELFEEPAYSDEYIANDPSFAYDNRVAYFVVMRWRKASPGRATFGSQSSQAGFPCRHRSEARDYR